MNHDLSRATRRLPVGIIACVRNLNTRVSTVDGRMRPKLPRTHFRFRSLYTNHPKTAPRVPEPGSFSLAGLLRPYLILTTLKGI